MFNIFGRKKPQEQQAVTAVVERACEDDFVMIERKNGTVKDQEAVAFPYPTVYPSLKKRDHSDRQGTALQDNASGPLSLNSGIDGVPFVLNTSLSYRMHKTDLGLLLHRIETVEQTLSLDYDFALEKDILREATRAQ